MRHPCSRTQVRTVRPPSVHDGEYLFCGILAFFHGYPFGALKISAVAQLQDARCDGMAHAIVSFVQRCTPQAGRRCGFQIQSNTMTRITAKSAPTVGARCIASAR